MRGGDERQGSGSRAEIDERPALVETQVAEQRQVLSGIDTGLPIVPGDIVGIESGPA
jgi:hypothetical protein